MRVVGLAVAVVAVFVALAVIYWPVALLVAGVGLGAVCLLTDDGKGEAE